jgi:hypothetical protein
LALAAQHHHSAAQDLRLRDLYLQDLYLPGLPQEKAAVLQQVLAMVASAVLAHSEKIR